MDSQAFTLLLERLNSAQARVRQEAFEALKSTNEYLLAFGRHQGLEEAKDLLEQLLADADKD